MIETPLRQRFGYLTNVGGSVPIFVAQALREEAEKRGEAGMPSTRGPSFQPSASEVMRDVLVAWALGEGRRCGATHPKHGICALERGHAGQHDSHPTSYYAHRWVDGEASLVGGLGSDE